MLWLWSRISLSTYLPIGHFHNMVSLSTVNLKRRYVYCGR